MFEDGMSDNASSDGVTPLQPSQKGARLTSTFLPDWMLADLGGMGFATAEAEACEEAAETATEAESSSNKALAPPASNAPASDWQPDVVIDDGMPC